MSDLRFYRVRDVIGDPKRGIPAIIPVSRSTWYQGIAAGRYPKPVKLSAKTSAWDARVIEELAERLRQGKWNEKAQEA